MVTAPIKPPPADKGSQRWLQILINERPDILDSLLTKQLGPKSAPVNWVSPLKGNDFREYRDMEALRKLNIRQLPVRSLASFWPPRGPVWDGLGRTATGELLLVEAKANIPEIASPASKATPDSLRRIRETLQEVRLAIAPTSKADWTGTFYQYTNRLAHLYLLRVLNGLAARLLFVYFLNADDVAGPKTETEWNAALAVVHAALEIQDHRLKPFVHDLFIDARALNERR